jgi:hypothetical protein
MGIVGMPKRVGRFFQILQTVHGQVKQQKELAHRSPVKKRAQHLDRKICPIYPVDVG